MHEYEPRKQGEMLINIKEEIKKTEDELEELEDKYDSLKAIARSYASKMILFGTTMAAGQVTGFAYLIYGVYSWDDIEPITYLTGAFYLTVSMAFWTKYRDDWEWSNAYNVFYSRKLRNMTKRQSFEKSRIEFLKRYRELLKLQLAYIEK